MSLLPKFAAWAGAVALLALAGCNTPAKPGIPAPIAQFSATSTFESRPGTSDCDLDLKTVNTKFSLATIHHRDSPKRHVLLRQSIEQSGCTNSERLQALAAVDGWVDQLEPGLKPTWHLQAEGDEGEIAGDFYRITRHGCCGATAASYYFNLSSGKKVFESAGDLLHVDVPNTPNERYIAFLDTWSALNPGEAQADPSIIGALQYGSADGPADRVLLHMKTSNPFSVSSFGVASSRDPANYVQDMELWPADGKKETSFIGGFQIRITGVEHGEHERTASVVVPVVADKLDLDHAVTNGIILERAVSK